MVSVFWRNSSPSLSVGILEVRSVQSVNLEPPVMWSDDLNLKPSSESPVCPHFSESFPSWKRLSLPPYHVLTQAELCSFRQITSQKPWQGSEVNVKVVPEVVFTGNLKCDLGCGKMWELSWTNCQSQFVRRNDLQFLLRSIRRSRKPVTIDTQVTLEHFGCSEYIHSVSVSLLHCFSVAQDHLKPASE